MWERGVKFHRSEMMKGLHENQDIWKQEEGGKSRFKKKKCIKVYDGGMKRKAGRQAQNIQDNGIKNSYSISPRLEK